MDKHDSLLLCSSSSETRQQIRGILEEYYHILEAKSVYQAILLLKQNLGCVAAVLLDISTTGKPDYAALEEEEPSTILQQLPTIILTKEETPALLQSAFSRGASDVIPLSYDATAMIHRIQNIVRLHLHKQYLESRLHGQADRIRQANETLIDGLSSIIEHRSVESGQHIFRIRHFTKILLEEVVRSCPEYQLNESIIPVISGAAALHDIGKIAIPDSILMKPGPLTEEERDMMKTHASTGCKILDSLGSMGDPEYMRYAHNICHYHHERWDGNGYPEGLSGDNIPICAQVVGLADVYDALTSKRVYKDAIPFSQAVNMILKGECGVFSPKLLECFKHVAAEYERLAKSYADGLTPESMGFNTALPLPAQQAENSLERTRAKYFAMVHYVNGLLLEMDLNNGLFHLIYNPYPELSWMQNMTSLQEMIQVLVDRIISPEDRAGMEHFFNHGVREFMDQDLRRSTQHVRLRTQTMEESAYEITMLRINPIDSGRKTLALLIRRESETVFRTQNVSTEFLSDSAYICRNDNHFTLVHMVQDVPLLVGYTRQEIAEQFSNRLIELVVPEDRDTLRRTLQEQLNRGTTAEAEFRVRHKNGSIRWLLNKTYLRIGSDGQEYLNSFLTDISHTKASYDLLHQQLQRYEIILAQTENVLFEWDLARDSLIFSETWEKIFGAPPVDISGRSVLVDGANLHPDDLPLLIDKISALEGGSHYETVEVRMATARGRYLWCRIRASAIRGADGRLQKVVGIIINIDAEKQAEKALQDRAERDALTKLLNKDAAKKQAEDYLNRFREHARCAMLIIDLDNFKQVNDQYGHLFGDAVLTKVAQEIEKLFRNQDIVSRIGGDEFMVVMRSVSDRALLEVRCRQLLQNLKKLFSKQAFWLPLSCSIGISMAPEHGLSYFDLFKHADQALYRAKAQGKHTFVFYDSSVPNLPELPNHQNTPIDSDVEPGLAEDTLVRFAFQQLYTTNDVDQSIHHILSLVGRKMNVSRVYVFENSDNNRFCSNTYEWCNNGIAPELPNLQNLSYEEDIPGYMESFNEQDLLYCTDIRELPAPLHAILEPQNIKSMLHCAIREGGVFRGYIGFDDCVEYRYWTKEQVQSLRYFSEMLSVFLMKKRENERSLRHASEIQSILDNQNALIYIIDPETCQLKYLNAKTRTLAPDAALGDLCYQKLRGMNERCPGCPSQMIQSTKNCSAIIENTHLNLKLMVDTTLIRWDGQDACLITCRELQETDHFE